MIQLFIKLQLSANYRTISNSYTVKYTTRWPLSRQIPNWWLHLHAWTQVLYGTCGVFTRASNSFG